MGNTLGNMADSFHALREKKRDLESQLKAVEREMSDKEAELMSMMDQSGVTKITGTQATISISESVKPSVENWEEFEDYIYKNKYLHLLERKASVTGCRELFDKHGRIPGVVPYIQRKLRMLSV